MENSVFVFALVFLAEFLEQPSRVAPRVDDYQALTIRCFENFGSQFRPGPLWDAVLAFQFWIAGALQALEEPYSNAG
jgi:hypothetical protein